MKYKHHYNSPLGGITMASNGTELTGLWFDGQRYFAEWLESDSKAEALPVFDLTVMWLDIYFSGEEPDFIPPLHLEGSDFRMGVWQILLTIPYGETRTYGEVAEIVASRRSVTKMSAQAVGGAVGHNPISLIVPCHRVIGANGGLTGYAGGIELKRSLLMLEQHTHNTILNTEFVTSALK